MSETPPSPEANAERTLRVATWNMDHWKRTLEQRESALKFLRTGLRADVALLQECIRPSNMSRLRVAYREIGGVRSWGTAVLSLDDAIEVEEIDTVRTRYGSRRFSMLGSTPGTIMVARATVPGFGPLTCVSVYGMTDVYAQTTMLRVVADLIPLFDSRDGEHVILGGDLNVSSVARKDEPSPHRKTEARRYEAILRAVESLGLVQVGTHAERKPVRDPDCTCGQADCSHFRTFGASQLDYLFATVELEKRCKGLDLVRSEWSDHSALVTEIAPMRLVGHRHDPASFVELLTSRKGEAVGRVAAALVTWAQRKHGEIRAKSSASLDRLPVSEGDSPKLDIQLDLPGRRLQWTIGIDSNANAVVHFQRMRPPFDDEPARERIYNRVNEIPGVQLERKLSGHPTFALEVIAQHESTDRLLGVLDYIVDETLDREPRGRSI